MNTNLIERLKTFNKIIVTGPPRSGTTITSLILAKELRYKFIDETIYDGGNQIKFLMLLNSQRKMVIHNTSFTRDLHQFKLLEKPNICILLVKRRTEDIIDSMDNTIKFMKDKSVTVGENGLFNGFSQEARDVIKKHFGYEGSSLSLPECIYDHFEKNKNPKINYLKANYPEDFFDHELFIKKEDRRKKFTHIKQVDFDPEYIDKRQGVVIL